MQKWKTVRLFIKYAWHFIGTEYRYGNDKFGGDDPVMGFDCSGFVTECLRGVGALKRNQRLSAQMLSDTFLGAVGQAKSASRGKLCLYGPNIKNIVHIGIAFNKEYMIHAGGGNRNTKDLISAAERNAFVRIDRIDYRKDLVGFADPFK